MIKILLKLPYAALANLIVMRLGGGTLAQIFGGIVACCLADALIAAL